MIGTPAPLFDYLPADGMLTESDARADTASLTARLTADGYLYFRGLVDTQRLLEVRRDVLDLCAQAGWLDDAAPVMSGTSSGRFPDAEEYRDHYARLIKLTSFNRLSTAPELLALLARLLGGGVLTHRRNIARITFPQRPLATTQPHQDYFYIRGTAQTYTAWIPLGDCPAELGGLAIAVGSNHAGTLEHEPTTGPGRHGVRFTGRWLTADYRLGDVVLFHSHTVHGAHHNRTADTLRLSVDFRYQRSDLPVDPSSLIPHAG